MNFRLTLPLKIGLGFGALGILLTVIGIMRGNVPANAASIFLALLIGGGVWFIVAWAVATAAVDVAPRCAPARALMAELWVPPRVQPTTGESPSVSSDLI